MKIEFEHKIHYRGNYIIDCRSFSSIRRAELKLPFLRSCLLYAELLEERSMKYVIEKRSHAAINFINAIRDRYKSVTVSRRRNYTS